VRTIVDASVEALARDVTVGSVTSVQPPADAAPPPTDNRRIRIGNSRARA
jgi:hypothetical protein